MSKPPSFRPQLGGDEAEAPDLGRVVSSIRAAARARLAERMLRLGWRRAAMRMAYAPLEPHMRLEAIGQSESGRFHLPMNRRGLGDFVGLSSVHVCRILGELAGSGVIALEGHMTIFIHKIEVMAELVGVDLQTLKIAMLGDNDFIPPALANPAYA
jgi:CRP/FNR family transcriptional regulator